MGRPVGAVGIIKREFETEFKRYCDLNHVSWGEGAAQMLEASIKQKNARDFVAISAVIIKATGDFPDTPQHELLIIDRSKEIEVTSAVG
ncbi:MAG: hypothetical protein ACC642_00050 [Pseudomonadales bacterium]